MADLRASRELSSGRVRASIVDGDVRNVRVDGLVLAERVTATARDRDWRTLPIRRRSLRVASSGEAAELGADHRDIRGDRPTIEWKINVLAADSGFEVDAIATPLADVEVRRLGLCLLLAWQPLVGAKFEAIGSGGRTSGVISRAIAPQYFRAGSFQPMFAAFNRLELSLRCGLNLDIRLEGEEFECEDQRNWTDPTFKIYPGPLAEAAPRTLTAGQQTRQTIRVGVDGPRRVRCRPPRARPVLSLRAPTTSALPDVGLEASAATPDVLRLLESVKPSHVRLSGRTDVPPPTLSHVRRLASNGSTIELALVLKQGKQELDRWLDLSVLVPAARLLLHRSDGRTSSAADLLGAKERLAGTDILLVGGTADQFSQLNRRPAGRQSGSALSFAITPQAHSVEEDSMMATLPIQRMVVESAVAASGSRPIIVSPVTLAMHDPADGLAPDPRLGSRFAGAWTLGSYIQIALGGAASITYHESAEHYAPIAGAPLPPVGRALACAASVAGLRMIPVHSNDPQVVMGIAGRATNGERTLLVVNLSSRRIEVDVSEGSPARASDRRARQLSLAGYAFCRVRLGASEAASAGR